MVNLFAPANLAVSEAHWSVAEPLATLGLLAAELTVTQEGPALDDVATLRGKSVQDTAMDLVVEDGSRVQVVYFLMSEDNV